MGKSNTCFTRKAIAVIVLFLCLLLSFASSGCTSAPGSPPVYRDRAFSVAVKVRAQTGDGIFPGEPVCAVIRFDAPQVGNIRTYTADFSSPPSLCGISSGYRDGEYFAELDGMKKTGDMYARITEFTDLLLLDGVTPEDFRCVSSDGHNITYDIEYGDEKVSVTVCEDERFSSFVPVHISSGAYDIEVEWYE